MESPCSTVCSLDWFFFLFFFNEQTFLLTKQLCDNVLNPRIFLHNWVSLLLLLNFSFPWPWVLHPLLQSSLGVVNLRSRWIVSPWCLGVEAFGCQKTRKTRLACHELTYERLTTHLCLLCCWKCFRITVAMTCCYVRHDLSTLALSVFAWDLNIVNLSEWAWVGTTCLLTWSSSFLNRYAVQHIYFFMNWENKIIKIAETCECNLFQRSVITISLKSCFGLTWGKKP